MLLPAGPLDVTVAVDNFGIFVTDGIVGIRVVVAGVFGDHGRRHCRSSGSARNRNSTRWAR